MLLDVVLGQRIVRALDHPQLSRTSEHSSWKTWAFAVPLSGPARRLDYGPAGDVALRDGAVLVASAMNSEPAEPAQWKRYLGGAGGKIWYPPDGSRYTKEARVS